MTTVRRYFGTDGIRGAVGTKPITPEFMLKMGWAIGSVLAKGQKEQVLIGKDTRISGYILESALEAGLISAGLDAYLLGPMPTPAIAYLTQKCQAKMGIVISASHNSYTDNGIKLFCQDGFKLPDHIELEIEEKLKEPLAMVPSAHLGKAFRLYDAADQYVEHCLQSMPSQFDLKGMRIVVDCANGATYRVAPNVLASLGANLINLAVNPDGLNINLNCGSTKPEMLQETVKAIKADIGIAFDGDGDRLIMVDETGEIVDGDEILFIIAQHQAKQLAGVAGTQMSNLGLEIALQQLGIPFARANVGDRYVLEMLKANQWTLGGESSGHIVDLGVSTTGDGLLSALQVLNVMQASGKTLAELKRGMNKFPQLIQNVRLPQAIDGIVSNVAIQAAIKAAESELGKTGRVLLRASGTEPVIRVMAEGAEMTQVKLIVESLVTEVESIISKVVI